MTFKYFIPKDKNEMNKLQEFEARKYQIEHNIDLSREGKTKALAALQRESENYRVTTVRDLGGQWSALKDKMRSNIESVKAAQAAAAATWDYGRLNYQAQAVKSAIANTSNFQEVQSLYNQAAASGDAHARRVWGEVVRENITGKYHGGDVAAFANQLKKDLEKVLTTPELDAAKSEGSELTKQARILYDETKQANEYFYGGRLGNNAIYGIQTEFEKLSAGVNIEQKIDAETLATVTTVSLMD
jgi:hypothetical protein